MVKVEDIQSYGKEHLETVAASASNLQSGVQAIATAYGDYAKKSFEDTKSFVEKLSGVKSLDKAIEAQTEYARSAYETFVAESQKIAGLYGDLAKQTFKPFEGLVAKFTPPRTDRRVDPRLEASLQRQKARPNGRAFCVFPGDPDYFATRSLEICVRIFLNASEVWLVLVIIWKLPSGVAQFFSTCDFGSLLSMLTWIVNTVTGLVLSALMFAHRIFWRASMSVSRCAPAVLGVQTVRQQDDVVLVDVVGVLRRRCDRRDSSCSGTAIPTPAHRLVGVAVGVMAVILSLRVLPIIAHRRHRGGKAVRPLLCVELRGRA